MAQALPFIIAAATAATTIKSFVDSPSGGQPQVTGPSTQEVTAQKKQKALTDAKTQRETSERAARGKIISARAAGPQTLFTRPGQIPRPVKLGGGPR